MSSINSSNGSVFPAKRPRTTRRVWAVLLSTGLLSGTAAVAEVVTVPTADGGEWQMTIAPQGTKFDYPASLRVAMQIKPGEQKAVPDPLDMPIPEPATDENVEAPETDAAER